MIICGFNNTITHAINTIRFTRSRTKIMRTFRILKTTKNRRYYQKKENKIVCTVNKKIEKDKKIVYHQHSLKQEIS